MNQDTPEAIVRALAACDPYVTNKGDEITGDYPVCGLCEAEDGEHHPHCLWLRAVAWVAARGPAAAGEAQ